MKGHYRRTNTADCTAGGGLEQDITWSESNSLVTGCREIDGVVLTSDNVKLNESRDRRCITWIHTSTSAWTDSTKTKAKQAANRDDAMSSNRLLPDVSFFLISFLSLLVVFVRVDAQVCLSAMGPCVL